MSPLCVRKQKEASHNPGGITWSFQGRVLRTICSRATNKRTMPARNRFTCESAEGMTSNELMSCLIEHRTAAPLHPPMGFDLFLRDPLKCCSLLGGSLETNQKLGLQPQSRATARFRWLGTVSHPSAEPGLQIQTTNPKNQSPPIHQFGVGGPVQRPSRSRPLPPRAPRPAPRASLSALRPGLATFGRGLGRDIRGTNIHVGSTETGS